MKFVSGGSSDIQPLHHVVEGWRFPSLLPFYRPYPTVVETTLPRMRQVGEGASPRLDTELSCGISQPKFKGPTEKLWLAGK